MSANDAYERVTEWAWDCRGRHAGKDEECLHPNTEAYCRQVFERIGGRLLRRTVSRWIAEGEWVEEER